MKVGIKRTNTEAEVSQTTSEAITEVQNGAAESTTLIHPVTMTPIKIIHPQHVSPNKKCKVEIIPDPDQPANTKMVRVEENIKLFDVGRTMYQAQVMSLVNFLWAIVSELP